MGATARRPPRWLGWMVSAALLAAAAWVLRGRWEAVGEAGGLPGATASATAAVLFAGANLVLSSTWVFVVRLSGAPLALRTGWWVWAISQLARYTLGAAQIGGRAIAGRRHGLTLTTGAATALVEVGWQTSITAALALATLPWWLPVADGLEWLAWIGLAPVAVLALGLVAPRRLLTLLGRLLATGPLRRLTGGRLDDMATRVALDRRGAAGITLLYTLNTGLRLAGFTVLFGALGGDVGADLPLVAGAYAVGQLVGRLAVFAPGGLGPREGATALAIAPAIGGGPALVLVAATRLLELVAELAFLGLARLTRGPTRGSRGRP